MANLIPKEMNSWVKCYNNGEHKNNRRYPESFVVKYLTSSAFKDISSENKKIAVDMGCGFGRNIGILADNYEEVVALDPSNEAINYIKKKYEQVKAYKFIPPVLPTIGSEIDLILACNSLYYIDDFDFEDYFKSIVCLMKKGGLFIFSMIGKNHDCLTDGIRLNQNLMIMNNDQSKFKSRKKVLIYQPQDLYQVIKLIKKNGLTILEKGELEEKYSITGTRHLMTYFCKKY